MPARLVGELAAALRCAPEALAAELPGSPATATAMYYADVAPETARQQSFAEALAQSDELSDEDRAYWLEAVRAEGLLR